MEYHYDYHNDRDGAQPPHQPNTPQRTPNPNGQSNDFGAWLLIGIMFLVAWPVGLILLIKKLTDNPHAYKINIVLLVSCCSEGIKAIC